MVAKESQKSENVDLKRLLSAEEKCVEIIRTLLNEEINPIRIVRIVLDLFNTSGTAIIDNMAIPK